MQKKRLDILLFEKGLTESREKAKSLIMSGIVFVNDEKIDKAGTVVDENANIEIRGNTLNYVSRGGLKLEKAMKCFPIDLSDKVCMDIGASTGGFTDCMLQNGAKKVFAVDVGYGQLAWKLRCDERVVNLERTNVRHLTAQMVGESIDFISVDVSFISLTLVLPVAKTYLRDKAEMVCLIKPQFEAGRENVGKKGVVRDKKIHIDVVNKIISFAKEIGFSVKGLTFSPVKGPEGNIEYLIFLKNESGNCEIEEGIAEFVVNQSHNELDV